MTPAGPSSLTLRRQEDRTSVLSTSLTLGWTSTKEDQALELWSWKAWSPSGYCISGLSVQTLEAVKVAQGEQPSISSYVEGPPGQEGSRAKPQVVT